MSLSSLVYIPYILSFLTQDMKYSQPLSHRKTSRQPAGCSLSKKSTLIIHQCSISTRCYPALFTSYTINAPPISVVSSIARIFFSKKLYLVFYHVLKPAQTNKPPATPFLPIFAPLNTSHVRRLLPPRPLQQHRLPVPSQTAQLWLYHQAGS